MASANPFPITKTSKNITRKHVDPGVVDRIHDETDSTSLPSLIGYSLSLNENGNLIRMEQITPAQREELLSPPPSLTPSLPPSHRVHQDLDSTTLPSPNTLENGESSPTSTWRVGFFTPLAIGGPYLAGKQKLSSLFYSY